MRFAEILQKVKGLESDDIYELLNNRGVVIQHRPDLFIYSDSDARIITNPLGDTINIHNLFFIAPAASLVQ